MIAEKSFRRDIETNNIFISENHKEALARLDFVVKNRCMALLTGDPGAGKSTIIRTFTKKLDASKYCVCYINNSELTPKALYSEVLYSLSVTPFTFLPQIKKQFSEVVINIFKNHNKQPVIFIDNAQSLPIQTIYEIRYMLNFEFDSMSPMSLILIGQPELFATLRLRTFEALFYRLSNHYQFRGLSQKQTGEYILHQLKLSNLSMLFPDDITSKIWSRSRGLPQIINTICTHCLIDMEANSLNLVDNAVLERVLTDLQY